GLRAPADKGLRRAPVRLGEKEPRQAPRLVGEGRKGVEPRHQLRAGREIGGGKASRHHFSARSSFSQRARAARSSSVIWLKLFGGIAWVSTACMAIAEAKREMCS